MSVLSYESLKTELSGNQRARVDSYLNSALYYLITGRKGAWLYKNHNSILVVCKHPHIEDRLLVFPEIGRADYELTASVLNMVKPPKKGVQLARYSEDELTALKQQLAKLSYTAVSGISVFEEDMMDWRCPVRILDTNVVAEMKGKAFDRVRNKFHKIPENITNAPLSQDNEFRCMKAAVKFWEGNMIARAKDTDDMSEFYTALFNVIKMYPDSVDGLFFMQGRRPLGFAVWDMPTADTVNLLARLSDTSVAGLADFQLVSTCQKLRDEGIKYVNLGGSELETLDDFKAKYQKDECHPGKTLKILSAEIVYRKLENFHFKNPDIEKHTIVPVQ